MAHRFLKANVMSTNKLSTYSRKDKLSFKKMLGSLSYAYRPKKQFQRYRNLFIFLQLPRPFPVHVLEDVKKAEFQILRRSTKFE